MAKKKKSKSDKNQKIILYTKLEFPNCMTQKVYIRYMDQQTGNIANSIDFKRLNCDIPKELHTWLNVYARSNPNESKSITEIVISVLGQFAKERGFKINSDGS